MSFLIGLLTFVLILVSVFLVLVVLAQKAKSDGGVGAAMGGGMAEATFGADTGNVLTKATINASIAFFVLSLGLYLGHKYQHSHPSASRGALPTIEAPASTTPAPAEGATLAPAEAAPVEGTSSEPAPAATPESAPAPAEEAPAGEAPAPATP